jgi:hypothetical protein
VESFQGETLKSGNGIKNTSIQINVQKDFLMLKCSYSKKVPSVKKKVPLYNRNKKKFRGSKEIDKVM